MKYHKNKKLIWAATLFCSVCWAYALVARFTNFFMASRLEKVILLGAGLTGSSLVSLTVFFGLLSGKIIFNQKALLKITCISSLVAFALHLFIFPPIYFPENHVLEVITNPHSGNENLTILSIQRVNLPSGKKEQVNPAQIAMQGSWQITSDGKTLASYYEPEDRISYTRLMQAGIEISFETGPNQGQALIIWDGQEYSLDLSSGNEGTHTILLKPLLDLENADSTRKALVILAYLAEILGVATIIMILFALHKTWKLRNHKLLLTGFFFLALLFPVVSVADPVVIFQDPQLEALIREIIKQPEGKIHKHKLLTIAKLDATDRGINNLEGINHLRNLEELVLRDNRITDITPISRLTRLRELDLRGNSIADISALEGLHLLEDLNLRGNPVTDISPLGQLAELEDLNLNGIPVGKNIDLLRGFHKLSRLNLRGCEVTNLSILAELMALGALQDDPILSTEAQLDIRDNPISLERSDGYAHLRPYWQNVSDRVPFVLPEYNTLSAPLFSFSSGFYKSAFELILSTPDEKASIHYTLNGSEPTRESPVYSHPLLIQERLDQANVYSEISSISPQWKKPVSEVFKATIVRAKAFSQDGLQSKTITQTYFVDAEIAERYTLPIISISADPDHLFDEKQGIYVMGQDMEGIDDPSLRNYAQSGKEWERPAHIEFFDPSGKLLIRQTGGIRIHGSSMRKYPQKSLRLYADPLYDESNYFEYRLFPNSMDKVESQPISRYKTLLLRNSGNNDEYPIFRDTIMHTLFRHTSLDQLTYHPVIVFLNGEYWGIYNLRENLDEFMLADRYQIEPKDIVILEREAQINFGQPGDELHYQSMLEYFRSHDLTISDNFKNVTNQMDIENYADYQIAEIYSANNNWPYDNIKYWRYQSDTYQPDAPDGQDGRWRWLLFDLDTGFGYGKYGANDDTLQRATGEFLFRNLLLNEDFKTLFINRFADHLNSILLPDHVLSVINDAKSALDPEIPEHIARWNIMANSIDVWDHNVDIMRAFARERPEHIRQHIINYFDLPGTASINLMTDSTRGYIRINSLDITSDTPGVVDAGKWSGIYFKGIPVSISAIAKPGFEFESWDGVDQNEANLQLSLDDDLALTANFVPVEQ